MFQSTSVKPPPAPPLPPVAAHAARVLQDSLSTLPRTVQHWAAALAAAFVRLLPRMAVAVLVAGVVILLSLWVRGLVRRRTPGGGAAHAQPPGTGLLGTLLAATAAAAIMGASTLAAALLTLAIFLTAASAVQFLGARVFSRSQVAPEAVELVLSVIRAALLTLGVVESLSAVGLNLSGVIAGLGIIGLAVGFAAQDTLANLIAGFTILWDRPLRVGEWVRVGDGPVAGRVAHLTLRTTRIETIQDGLLVIPNKDVTGSRLYNLSRPPGAVVRIAVTVAADADLERVRSVLREVASNAHADVVVSSIGDSATTLELIVPAGDYGTFRTLRSTLLEAAAAGLRGAGIKFADVKAAT